MKEKHDYQKQGKKNRAAGLRFEAKVRENLESMGWIVSKWMNTVDYEKEGKIGKLVPSKRKYNPYMKAMVLGTGFPDFIAFKRTKENFEVIGVENKKRGYLDPVERGMCYWLLENKIFLKILIAKQSKKRGEIEYVNFKAKYKDE